MFVDGWLLNSYSDRQLAIAKVHALHIGSYLSSAVVDAGGRIAISRLRMHDGALSADDVRYNYLTEGLQFQATPSQTSRSVDRQHCFV